MIFNFINFTPIELIFTLLIVFQIKHFICDFPLQGKFMLGKFKPGWDFVLPLAAHSGVQALGTLLVTLLFAPELCFLAPIDFTLHFIIDRLKADKRLLGRWNPQQPYFWWALGFDQCLHHITHYGFILVILLSKGF